MTALQKPGGGVRGIVATLFGALPGRSPSNWEKPWRGPQPLFQNALTRASSKCIADALQALSEVDPKSTVLSIDGISASDLISRRAMLSALARIEGGGHVFPFVKLFYDAPSHCGGKTRWGSSTKWIKAKGVNRETR